MVQVLVQKGGSSDLSCHSARNSQEQSLRIADPCVGLPGYDIGNKWHFDEQAEVENWALV
jgi:hypothetical protein